MPVADVYKRQERENLRALRDKYHLDESSSGIVTREDIEDVVSRWTGVPITSIKEEETQKLLRVEEELHKRVIAQDKAISALARAIRRSRAGLKNPARPIGSFLFLGPTGVGKTEVARTLAQFLFEMCIRDRPGGASGPFAFKSRLLSRDTTGGGSSRPEAQPNYRIIRAKFAGGRWKFFHRPPPKSLLLGPSQLLPEPRALG